MWPRGAPNESKSLEFQDSERTPLMYTFHDLRFEHPIFFQFSDVFTVWEDVGNGGLVENFAGFWMCPSVVSFCSKW